MSHHRQSPDARGMRSRRAAHLFAVLLGALAAATPAVSPALAGDPPARTGTILSAVYTTGYAGGCYRPGVFPECAAWLASDCDPALAGKNPAVTMSIEDVGELASRPKRVFDMWVPEVAGVPAGWAIGGVAVQFWSAECRHLRSGPSRYWPGSSGWDAPHLWFPDSAPPTAVEIPSGAKWITVSGNDNTPIMWSLT